MIKIDTSKWGDFKVGDLFDIHPTKAYKLTNSKLMSENGMLSPLSRHFFPKITN